jgi:hypothetical protein
MKNIILATSFFLFLLNAKAQNLSLIGKSYQDVMIYQSNMGGISSPNFINSSGHPMVNYNITNPHKIGLKSYSYIFNKDSVCTDVQVTFRGSFNSIMKPYLDKNFQKQEKMVWNKPSKDLQVIVFEVKEIHEFFLNYRSLNPDL